LVSEWEGDKKEPTTEMYVLLGGFASRIGRVDDAFWFWERGKLKKDELLSASAVELKKRRALPPAGEVVRISPAQKYAREQSSWVPQSALPVPAKMIPNLDLTSYFRVPDESMRPTFKENDIIIVDGSEKDPKKLEGFLVAAAGNRTGELVGEALRKALGEWAPTNDSDIHRGEVGPLRVGWLRTRKEGKVSSLVLESSRDFDFQTSEVLTFSAQPLVKKVVVPGTGKRNTASVEIIIDDSSTVLGRVIGWLSCPVRTQVPARKQKVRK